MKSITYVALLCLVSTLLLSGCGGTNGNLDSTIQPMHTSQAAAWETTDLSDVIGYLQSEDDENYKQGIMALALRQWDAQAKYELGERMDGQGKDREALDWYQKAADQGHVKAQLELGVMHDPINSKEKAQHSTNFKEAVKWYEMAAEQGDAEAQFRLAQLLQARWDVEEADPAIQDIVKDLRDVESWYTKAANQGHGAAMNKLGVLRYYGRGGVTQDFDRAWELIFHAALNYGVVPAFHSIGAILDTDNKDAPFPHLKDDREAVRWYRLAAERNFPRAQEALGDMYKQGRGGLKKNPTEAYKWYALATRTFQDADSEHHNSDLGKTLEEKRNKLQTHGPAANVNTWKPMKRAGTGTGFYVDQKHILTNDHVVQGCNEVRVPPDQVVTVTKSDQVDDLALLAVSTSGSGIKAAEFRQASREVQPGEEVIVVGHPLHSRFSAEASVTRGNVISSVGLANDEKTFRLSAPVQSGNSGGPVLDLSGRVIGVVVAKDLGLRRRSDGIEVVQNINYAIKGHIAYKFIDDSIPKSFQRGGPIQLQSFIEDSPRNEYVITDTPDLGEQPAGYLFSFPTKNDPKPPHAELEASYLDPKLFKFEQRLLSSIKVPFHRIPYYKRQVAAEDKPASPSILDVVEDAEQFTVLVECWKYL